MDYNRLGLTYRCDHDADKSNVDGEVRVLYARVAKINLSYQTNSVYIYYPHT